MQTFSGNLHFQNTALYTLCKFAATFYKYANLLPLFTRTQICYHFLQRSKFAATFYKDANLLPLFTRKQIFCHFLQGRRFVTTFYKEANLLPLFTRTQICRHFLQGRKFAATFYKDANLPPLFTRSRIWFTSNPICKRMNSKRINMPTEEQGISFENRPVFLREAKQY